MATCHCPDLILEEWNDKVVHLGGTFFYSMKIPMLLHVPVSIEKQMAKIFSEIDAKGLGLVSPYRMLQKDGLFSGSILVEIQPPEVEDPNVVNYADSVFATTTVQSDHWGEAAKVAKKYIKTKGYKDVKGVYFWYVSCPICFKERGARAIIFVERPAG